MKPVFVPVLLNLLILLQAGLYCSPQFAPAASVETSISSLVPESGVGKAGGPASGAGKTAASEEAKFASLRERMVTEQIVKRGVKDSLVLKAMRKVPRHLFVPEYLRGQAYNDYPLPIGFDQTISQPFIVAAMTELLGLKGGEKVLEIGTGSGYQAAVLREIADKVFSIEIVEGLAKQAPGTLKAVGYSDITVIYGDGYRGLPKEAPFDAIIVTAAPGHVPQPLVDQLKNGGRMVIPVGEEYQELLLITKKGNRIAKKSVFPVRFVPMTGEAQKKK
ncbi:MAG: protein-L-isoaspartate(D-aspartate) O-methyltransferase [Candidatus Eisenbacteria bacterium]|nr:protein-L-isoaspartate(D-aspartate) O-methyltransferase [Candidatus Eisenbacteria bacterium]